MRAFIVAVSILVIFGLAWMTGGTAVGASPTPTYEATIWAYQTQVAKLDGKIDRQATSLAKRANKISEQQTQIADLKAQIPPTATSTPSLSGKDLYPYVSDPQEIYTRPFNHYGEKMSFCGTVGFIEVAPPGSEIRPVTRVSAGWTSIVQVTVDGFDVRFVAGFNGDTTGIYEGSHVCVWGDLVDTLTGTNTFGGTIVNPFFDAAFLEIG